MAICRISLAKAFSTTPSGQDATTCSAGGSQGLQHRCHTHTHARARMQTSTHARFLAQVDSFHRCSDASLGSVDPAFVSERSCIMRHLEMRPSPRKCPLCAQVTTKRGLTDCPTLHKLVFKVKDAVNALRADTKGSKVFSPSLFSDSPTQASPLSPSQTTVCFSPSTIPCVAVCDCVRLCVFV